MISSHKSDFSPSSSYPSLYENADPKKLNHAERDKNGPTKCDDRFKKDLPGLNSQWMPIGGAIAFETVTGVCGTLKGLCSDYIQDPLAEYLASSTLESFKSDRLHSDIRSLRPQVSTAVRCLAVWLRRVFDDLCRVRHNIRTHGASGYYLLPISILTMFAIAIVLWTLDLANFIMEAKITLIEGSGDAIGAKYREALAFVFRLEAVEDVLYAYMTLLGDAIIIHRVWGLRALLVPCAILFGSFVATVMLTVCVLELGSNIDSDQENFKSLVCANVQIITYVMLSANTAIATGLIALTAWRYRKSIAPILRDNGSIVDGADKPKPTQIERILVLLLESGILYFLFFATQIVIASPPIRTGIESLWGLAFALKIYSYSSSVIVGLHPTILIVLARSKHKVLDRAAASSVVSSLRIARQYTDSGRDRTPTFQIITQIGANRADEPELDSLASLAQDDEEKGKRSSRVMVGLEYEANPPAIYIQPGVEFFDGQHYVYEVDFSRMDRGGATDFVQPLVMRHAIEIKSRNY
ncbi:hypothetical protein C8R45DRAFT_1076866 [Mycena sanguinolenta]|nr:hypothetical protein C8R45DRAFT_1076866 [Mycena sanguinolenta]